MEEGTGGSRRGLLGARRPRGGTRGALGALIADAWRLVRAPAPGGAGDRAELLERLDAGAAGGARTTRRPVLADAARDSRRVGLAVAAALSRLRRLDRARGRGARGGPGRHLRRQPRRHGPRRRSRRGRRRCSWVAEFVGYPCAEGAFTSGGMISNLTGLLVARERALPGCRVDGFAGRQRRRLLLRRGAPLDRPRGRGRRHRLGLRAPHRPWTTGAGCASTSSTRRSPPTSRPGSSRSQSSPTAARR